MPDFLNQSFHFNKIPGWFIWALKKFEKHYSRLHYSLESFRTSLVVQWIRIRLPMQGTWILSLVQEDSTCHGGAKLVCHNYWACVLQLLKSMRLESVLHNRRSHHDEKPAYHKEESPLFTATREKPAHSNKTSTDKKQRKRMVTSCFSYHMDLICFGV